MMFAEWRRKRRRSFVRYKHSNIPKFLSAFANDSTSTMLRHRCEYQQCGGKGLCNGSLRQSFTSYLLQQTYKTGGPRATSVRRSLYFIMTELCHLQIYVFFLKNFRSIHRLWYLAWNHEPRNSINL